MKLNNGNQKHKKLENYINNNKNIIVEILNLYIDSEISDLKYIFNYCIDDRKVDCVIICNTGHIILLEIKSGSDRKDIRDAITQLSVYKQLFKKKPFITILKRFEDTPTLKQFLDTNKISEDLIIEQYNKINDYYTITFVSDINNKLINYYKEQIISQNLYNSFLIIFTKNNGTDAIHTYSIETKQINVNGKSIENLLKDVGNEFINQLSRNMNKVTANTQLLVSKSTLIEELHSTINKIDKNLSSNYSIKEAAVNPNFTNLDFYDEIEEMRNLLIQGFEKSKSLNINDFKKYIIQNKSLPSLYKIQGLFQTTNLTKILSDGGCDVRKLRKSAREEKIKSDLIKKVQKVYEKHKKISSTTLRQEGIVNKVISHFGSIEEACEQANIPYIKNKRKNTMSKDDIIYLMNNTIIPEFTYENKPYTQKNLSDYGITSDNIRINFGSINELKNFFIIYD